MLEDMVIISRQELFENVELAKNLDNAMLWNEETDKFVFCIDLLGLSAWEDRSDGVVEGLEDWFEKTLKANDVEVN